MVTRRSARNRGPRKRYTEELAIDDETADNLDGTRDQDETQQKAAAIEDEDTAMKNAKPVREEDHDTYEAPPEEAEEPESEASDFDVNDEEVGDQTLSPSAKARKSKTRQPVTSGGEGYMQLSTMRGPQHSVLGYIASYDRSTKGLPLLKVWYGPEPGDLEVARRMLERWYGYPVLPPRLSSCGRAEADAVARVWRPGDRPKEQEMAQKWFDRMQLDGSQKTSLRILPKHEASRYAPDKGAMPVLLGPHDRQKEEQFSNGRAMCLTNGMLPLEAPNELGATDVATEPSGWILDTGGLPLDLSWATTNASTTRHQLLAVAVVPHADQELYNYEKESQKADFQKFGTVQVWSFGGEAAEVNGAAMPSASAPTRLRTICLDYGRAKRLSWSPQCQVLAILCGDGSVCIIELDDSSSGENEWVQQATARLMLDDTDIKATCLTWCGCNRVAVGYSDGSLALWSVFPQRMLSRHPVHHNPVVEMSSAYPTFPYLVASSPVGGPLKLTDLRAPSYDTTESTSSGINTQPHTVAWSDHLLGFFCLLPSNKLFGTVVGFAHHEFFPALRRISSPESAVTALAAGKEHPYLLTGTMDGSVWAINPQVVLFGSRGQNPDRIRVLQHEHRGANLFPEESPAAQRGAARLLEGAKKERNVNMRFDPKAAKIKTKTKKEASGPAQPSSYDGPAVLQEPLTRVTAIEWNPNDGYGCWAAISFASGLVRVIDLGLKV